MYQIVFHRTSTAFKRELTRGQKEDTILKVYPPLKIIVYKEGVTKRVGTRVLRIIETDNPNEIPTSYLIVKISNGVSPTPTPTTTITPTPTPSPTPQTQPLTLIHTLTDQSGNDIKGVIVD